MGLPLGFGRVPIKKSSLVYVFPEPKVIFNHTVSDLSAVLTVWEGEGTGRTPCAQFPAPFGGYLWVKI